LYYPTNKGIFEIDEEDLPIISVFKWWELPSGYIYSQYGKKKFYVHRLLMKWPEEDTDHIDRNKRNNKKENLRKVNRRENNNNLSTNGIFPAGVRYRKTHKFILNIQYKKHLKTIAGFPDPLSARIIYEFVIKEIEGGD